MPQLDTIYFFITYLWSWSVMYLIMQKTTIFKMVTNPPQQQTNRLTTTTPLPW